MTDWKALASALAPDIPADELEGVTGPLQSLEAQFRPLASAIPVETNPAYLLLMSGEAAE